MCCVRCVKFNIKIILNFATPIFLDIILQLVIHVSEYKPHV